MSRGPLVIEDVNVSRAWARAFLSVMEPGSDEVMPVIVKTTGFTNGEPGEDKWIRQRLDEEYNRLDMNSCNTVAETIFPRSLWNPALGRDKLFTRYLNVLPGLKQADARNRYGMYFERLIAYGNGKFNQLDHIIRTYQKGNHRRTALQASIFDPTKDHTDQPRRGFPCLQHVTFMPTPPGGLEVTGFYATQYLFERAYGNYLGLCRLGYFMAHEMGLEVKAMTCIASVGVRDVQKSSLEDFVSQLEARVHDEAVVAER